MAALPERRLPGVVSDRPRRQDEAPRILLYPLPRRRSNAAPEVRYLGDMTGHIRRRGARSWELKFDLGTDPLTGRRKTAYHSFKGTKREADAELVRLLAAADRGDYVDPAKTTVAEFLDRWEGWAGTQVS